MAEYRDRFAELTSLGIGLTAISVDAPDRARAVIGQLRLPFPVLCDPTREVVESWGLLNSKEKGGIAYPATYVLDLDRTVRFRSLDRTASRVELGELFGFLRRGIQSVAPAARRSRTVPRVRDFLRATANMLRRGIRSPRE